MRVRHSKRLTNEDFSHFDLDFEPEKEMQLTGLQMSEIQKPKRNRRQVNRSIDMPQILKNLSRRASYKSKKKLVEASFTGAFSKH